MHLPLLKLKHDKREKKRRKEDRKEGRKEESKLRVPTTEQKVFWENERFACFRLDALRFVPQLLVPLP